MQRRHLLLAPALGLPARAKLRVLIIDGMNNHDWVAGTRALRQILTSSGRFTVDVSTTPAQAGDAAWAQWRPKFAGYDAVVNNFNGGHLATGVRWPEEVEQDLDAYVTRGGGLVVFHAANNAFLSWARYNEMIGLGWRDPDFGPGLIIADASERPVEVPPGTGPRPGHGPRHDFAITTRDPRHAITKGMPKQWLHPAEQLTHGQHGPPGMARQLTVLTYAWSKDSLRREPMDWVRRWGRGRIYVTMLGHTWRNERNPNLQCRAFGALLARGTEWSATGGVTLGLPSVLPTRESIALDERVSAEPA